MATQPDFEQLKARVAADLSGLPAALRMPLAATWAKVAHGQYEYLNWVLAQCSPLTCEAERLADYAAVYSVPRLEATAAAGSVAAAGSAGAVVLAGALLRGPNGLDYRVAQAVTLSGAAAVVGVVCVTPGAAGNLPAGAVVTLIDPVAGLLPNLTVDAAGLGGGAEQEQLELWRVRVVEQWQTITNEGPRYGKRADYIYWAKTAHPSVTGALVQPHALGLGTVLVRPICNALAQRLPTATILTAVESYLMGRGVLADIRVQAPIVRPVTVSLTLVAAQDTAANRALIETALQRLMLSKNGSQGGVDLPDTLEMAEIDAAVASVSAQYTRHAPLVNMTTAPGEVLVLQSLSFV